MSRARSLPIALVFVAAAAGVAWLAFAEGLFGEGGSPSPVEITRVGPDRAPGSGGGAGAMALASDLEDGRADAALGPATPFELLVLDERGARLSEATVRLTSDDGQELVATSSQTWKDFPAGNWRVEATHPGLLPYHRDFPVVAQRKNRLVVQMWETLPVRGRVIDRFETPLNAAFVWLLPEGESHPVDEEAAVELQKSITNMDGTFELRVGALGRYRLSAGKPGKALVTMSSAIELHPGGPQEVEGVVSNRTQLEVVLDNPPAALAEGRADLTLSLLVKEAPRRRNGARSSSGRNRSDSGGDARVREGRRGERPVREATTSPPGEADQGSDGAQGAPAERPRRERTPRSESWKEFGRNRIEKPGEALTLHNLLPGTDYRLRLRRRRDCFESESFVLLPDRPTRMRLTLPSKRTEGEMQAAPMGLLPFATEVDTLPEDAPEPGFHWR